MTTVWGNLKNCKNYKTELLASSLGRITLYAQAKYYQILTGLPLNKDEINYLLMLLLQSTGTHSSQLTAALQHLVAFNKNIQSLLALLALVLDKLFMYGEELGHFDQPSKLDHQFALRHELSP